MFVVRGDAGVHALYKTASSGASSDQKRVVKCCRLPPANRHITLACHPVRHTVSRRTIAESQYRWYKPVQLRMMSAHACLAVLRFYVDLNSEIKRLWLLLQVKYVLRILLY